jgi:hypothetical protein
MNDLWKNSAIVVLYTTHYLSIAVWVGVMLFNLIVNFPAIRSHAKNASDQVAGMGALARRAGPWLYILVFLTLASGWALSSFHGGISATRDVSLILAKNVLLVVMLASHLWASFLLWPRIYFAVEKELPRLFFQYQMTIVLSSVSGIAAILLTYMWRVFAVA